MTENLPLDPEGFSLLANAYTAAGGGGGQYEKALEAYKSYARLKPDDFAAQNLLGEALSRAGQYTEAAGVFQKALSRDPKDIIVLRNLGKNLALAGQYKAALLIFKQIEESNPYGFETYFILGDGYRLAGKYDKSIEQYKNALVLKWDDVATHYGLALSYLAKRDKREALREYEFIKAKDAARAEQLYGLINKRR
jgi:tetratricopeptide (TPR) repeat protein